MCQNNNLYLYELSVNQIYVEILKRFPKKKYNTGKWRSMKFFFGPDWRGLDPINRKKAEKLFIKGITQRRIKGIRYEYYGNNNRIKKDSNGDVLYLRIPNDKYQ